MMNTNTKYEGETKRLVIIRGKGTAKETRIPTSIIMYWSKALQMYVTIPDSK